MLDFKTEIIRGACDRCKTSFDEEVIIINGSEVADSALRLCPECLEGHKASIDKQNRIGRAEEAYRSLLSKEDRDVDLSHPKFNSKLLTAMRAWYDDTSADKSIGVVGKTGKSKTKCFSLLAQRMLHEGQSVGWCNASELDEAFKSKADNNFSEFARDRKQQAVSNLEKWKRVKQLIIDDLGKGSLGKATSEGLYNLINHRWSKSLPINWSANAHPQEIFANLPTHLSEPLVRRLTEKTKIINLI